MSQELRIKDILLNKVDVLNLAMELLNASCPNPPKDKADDIIYYYSQAFIRALCLHFSNQR